MKTRILTSISFITCFAGLTFAQIKNIPGDYATIQEGIDAASEGDTVLVSEDTYYENINFKGKAITVGSHFILDGDTSHISKTIIDGSQPTHPDTASVVLMISGEDSTSVLTGFTITGGSGTNLWKNLFNLRGGGAICCIDGGGKIESNVITGNEVNTTDRMAYAPGIICVVDSNRNLVIRSNTIQNNSSQANSYAAHYGGIGLVAFNDGGTMLIEGNLIVSNTVESSSDLAHGAGIGISIAMPSTPYEVIIRNNFIAYNKALGSGGRGAGISIHYAFMGGGVINDPDPCPLIYNNIIEGNEAELRGGAIRVKTYDFVPGSDIAPEPIISNNTIIDNSAPQAAGLLSVVTSPVVFNNIIWDDLSPEGSTEFLEEGGEIFAMYNIIQGMTDSEKHNFGYEPEFEEDSFKLKQDMPGIGHGTGSLEINGNTYYAYETDYWGYARPNSVDGDVDCGAVESTHKSTVGIDEKDMPPEQGFLDTYPNPVRDQLTIEMKNHTNINRIEILSLDGRLVRIIDPVGSPSVTINRENLPAGMYFLRIHSDKIYTAKVLVE